MALKSSLIIGLGNPGHEYRDNRHNAGFMLVDWLIVRLNPRYETAIQSHRHGRGL